MNAAIQKAVEWRGAQSWPTAAILLLLIAAGSSFFVFVYDFQPSSDDEMYRENARALCSFEDGRLLTWHRHYIAYSTLIAPAQAMGVERRGLAFINLLLQCAMALSVFALVRRRGGVPLAAPVALVLAGLYPAGLYATGLVLTETLFTLLLVATVACALTIKDGPRWTLWTAAALLGVALTATRPTGMLVAAGLSVTGAVYFLLRKSFTRGLLTFAWIPTFALFAVLFTLVYSPREHTAPNSGLQWLAFSTYLTEDGDSFDATRQRQAKLAKSGASNDEIALFIETERNALDVKIIAELQARGYELPDVVHVRRLPNETLRRVIVDNVTRHPGFVIGHFARNLFWNMWFTRDNMSGSRTLLIINLPYLLFAALGLALLVRAQWWTEVVIALSIILPLLALHTLFYAISRYAAPFIPLFALLGCWGLCAKWRRRFESSEGARHV